MNLLTKARLKFFARRVLWDGSMAFVACTGIRAAGALWLPLHPALYWGTLGWMALLLLLFVWDWPKVQRQVEDEAISQSFFEGD